MGGNKGSVMLKDGNFTVNMSLVLEAVPDGWILHLDCSGGRWHLTPIFGLT